MNPVFWQPSNSIGTAATVDVVFEGQPIKTNFYWTAAELSIQPKTREQLIAQVNEFIKKHPLVNPHDKNVFYLQRNGNDFVEISDPGWIAPART